MIEKTELRTLPYQSNSGSFRDPSGFVFRRDGVIYRQVNNFYKNNFDLLINSGLNKKLTDQNFLIPFEEVDLSYAVNQNVYKVLKPKPINLICYPYEWSFTQYKDAALLTLLIQKIAVEHGMSLKDASSYNVQFQDGRPVFIDTLSFEKYEEGKPWTAYRQFCQHFLAPLALMSYRDIRLQQLMKVYIDGVPLDLTSTLLPFKTKFKFSLLSHIYIHAKGQKKYEKTTIIKKQRKISKYLHLALIDSLESSVRGLSWKPKGTEWGDYYKDTNYTDDAMKNKKVIVGQFLEKVNPKSVWDLGANTGVFSRLASSKGIFTVAFDIDPAAVEKNYLDKGDDKNILPLLMDISNPSSGIGWLNEERLSFFDREIPEAVFALALIHHLAISNNIPFNKLAFFFSKICRFLVIEFIPKSDSQVRKLLATREDIFHSYNQESFEKEFEHYFDIVEKVKVSNSERTLFLMSKK